MKLILALFLITLNANAAGFVFSGIKHDITSTATAGGTTTITKSNNQVQVFTGTSTQDVHLPAANTLQAGYWYTISNESSASVTVRNASGTSLKALTSGQSATFYVSNVGSVAGTWNTMGGTLSATGGYTYIGSVSYPLTSNCEWQISSSTIGNFSADSDCSAASATGSVSAPGTKIPAVTFTATSGKYYKFNAVGLFHKTDAGAAYGCVYRFSDGTNHSESSGIYGSTNDFTSTGFFTGTISGMSGSVTVNLQGANDNNSNVCSINARNLSGLVIHVYEVTAP